MKKIGYKLRTKTGRSLPNLFRRRSRDGRQPIPQEVPPPTMYPAKSHPLPHAKKAESCRAACSADTRHGPWAMSAKLLQSLDLFRLCNAIIGICSGAG